MTWEIKAGLMGKRTPKQSISRTYTHTHTEANPLPLLAERESAAHLLSHFPGIDLTIDTYLAQRRAGQNLRWPHVALLPGIDRLVRHLHAHAIPIAIATGSSRPHYGIKTSGHKDLFVLFGNNVVCADDGAHAYGRGKPCPDVYLYAARELLGRQVGEAENDDVAGVTEGEREERARGLVFEDAIPGMQAGVRAGMQVVWVPDEGLMGVPYEGVERATVTLKSVEEFRPEEWGLPPYND